MEILMLAAWFHDTGFVESEAGHEWISATIASRFLRGHSYPEKKIARVTRCILATKMPRHPRSLSERILCDADLASLGKPSFFKRNEFLRIETEHRRGQPINPRSWLRRTLHFMDQTHFYTRCARTLFGRQRSVNLCKLRLEIRALESAEARNAA
jgi:predicted metal-dependent HD superfamily phosphohydrolase